MRSFGALLGAFFAGHVAALRVGPAPGLRAREAVAPVSPPRGGGFAILFAPGIDGTGRCGQRQWRRLQHFVDAIDVLTIEPEDTSSFEEIVAFVLAALRERRAAGQRTLLVGESLGAVVSLGAALAEPDLVDALALINPATSIGETWVGPLGSFVADTLPEPLYRSLPAVITPLFGAAGWFEGVTGQPLPDFPTPQALLALSNQLSDVLPAPALKHRLGVLSDGAARVASRLASAKAAGGAAWPWARRCALIATTRDLVLPSTRETSRLAALIPGSTRRVVDGPGHACLDDDRVNLLQLLTAAAIFELARDDAGDAPAGAGGAAAGAASGSGGGAVAPGASIAARRAVPAVKRELSSSELAGERLNQLEGAAALASPVFFSRGADGSLERGVHSIPLPQTVGGRPVLFAGNHQLYGIDGPLLVREVLNERGVLIKALVYPPLMGKGFGDGADATSQRSSMPLHPLPYPPSGTAEIFEMYGARPISARVLVQLLAAGEPVLIFPGGAREVFKRKGEAYRLFWPDAPDLMRIAAKYDAVVVPFSGVGSDELGDVVVDTDEILALPIVGDWFRQRVDVLPSLVKDDLFVPPLVVPRVDRGIPRHYFLFGEPIDMAGVDRSDEAAIAQKWAQLRAAVEDGLAVLQRKRADDPYAEFYRRTAYERIAEGRQAPSFM